MGLGRVLVVDEEEDIRKSARLILTKAGDDVTEADFQPQFPSAPVTVLTGHGSVDKATTLFKQGVLYRHQKSESASP